MLVRVVKMHFSTSFIDEFKSIFMATKAKIASFEGCNGVKLLQHETIPEIFFTISNWENTQALENYRNSDLFKNTWARVKPQFISKAEAWSLIEQ